MPAIAVIFDETAYPGAVASVTLTNIARGDGSVIVAGPVAMTQSPAGTFSYTPPGDTAGMVYSYTRLVTFINGQTQTRTLSSGATSAVGYYTTQERIKLFGGKNNTDEEADLNEDGTQVIPKYQEVLNTTDNWVNRKLRAAGYVTPLSTSSADFAIVSDLATRYARALLHIPRGALDKDATGYAGQMNSLMLAAESELDTIIHPLNPFDGVRISTAQTGPSVVSNRFGRYGYPGCAALDAPICW